MSERDNGGPAFPVKFINDGDMNETAPDGTVVAPGFSAQMSGMTLRDYFAAKAMQVLFTRMESDVHAALRAYEIADAMLDARRQS
jgi:hypothetical protein